MLAIFFIIIIALTFSFTFWYKLFAELDYFKINLQMNKKKMLWVKKLTEIFKSNFFKKFKRLSDSLHYKVKKLKS